MEVLLNMSIWHYALGTSPAMKKSVLLSRARVHAKSRPSSNAFLKAEAANQNMINNEGSLHRSGHTQQLQNKRAVSVAYVRFLQNIRTKNDLSEGKKIHAEIKQRGLESDLYVGSSLVSMYAKCGSVMEARRVFDSLPKRDIFSWTAIISGYAKKRDGKEALLLFDQMKQEGIKPDQVTFVCILNACASLADLGLGIKIHADVKEANFENNVFVGAALVDMYAKCADLARARRVFNNMVQRDCVSWNAMVAGYAKHGRNDEALELFRQMKQKGFKPDSITYVSILNMHANLGALEQGKQIHGEAIRSGFESDIYVGNAIIDMYAKCGCLPCARTAFDRMPSQNVISWNTLMAGYVKSGHAEEAFKLYQHMKQLCLRPDNVTLVCMLNACADLGVLEHGKQAHADVIKAGLESHLFVAAALIDMYIKCGNIIKARNVFEASADRDLVCWSVIIGGYVKEGNAKEALSLYQKMKQKGVKPDSMTFVSILNACAKVAVLEEGEQVHRDLIDVGLQLDIFIGNALIDMYGKCGSMQNARKVFHWMPTRDIVSWNAIITGYCMNGRKNESLELFRQMQEEGFKPDEVTFVSLISLCSHLGLLEEGQAFFEHMSKQHGVAPTLEHYGCVVDLLSRAGSLVEAYFFIKKMQFPPTAELWKTLLGACRLYGNVKLAECVAEHIFSLEPHDSATFVLLSNMYATAGKWDSRAQLRTAMGHRGLTKEPG